MNSVQKYVTLINYQKKIDFPVPFTSLWSQEVTVNIHK